MPRVMGRGVPSQQKGLIVKLFMVIYVGGELLKAVGPVDFNMATCQDLSFKIATRVGYAIAAGMDLDGYPALPAWLENAKNFTIRCEYRE